MRSRSLPITTKSQSFPIPMRGNEHEARIAAQPRSKVSDPHEG